MIAKETLKKIAEVLKVDVSVFEEKLKSDKEETLEVPAIVTEDDKVAFGNNRFNEGKKAASEILVKDLKEQHKLEFEGKTVDKFLQAFSDKVIADAKIEPDKQVSALKAEKKALQDQISGLTTERDTLTKNHAEALFQVEKKAEAFSYIPDNTSIPKQDIIDLYFGRHRVAKEDGVPIIYKGSTKLVDNVLNPIPLKDSVLQFSEGYKKQAGMGGGDAGGGGGAVPKFKSASEAYKYLKDKGIEPLSNEGLKLLNDNKDSAYNPNS